MMPLGVQLNLAVKGWSTFRSNFYDPLLHDRMQREQKECKPRGFDQGFCQAIRAYPLIVSK